MFKRLIVVSGPVGSGKSTLATSLVDKFDVRVVKTREVTSSMTTSNDERAVLQAAGNRLYAKTKGKWVADAVARYVEQFDDDVEVLVDSVRIPIQIDALRYKFGLRVVHVHLTADDTELA